MVFAAPQCSLTLQNNGVVCVADRGPDCLRNAMYNETSLAAMKCGDSHVVSGGSPAWGVDHQTCQEHRPGNRAQIFGDGLQQASGPRRKVLLLSTVSAQATLLALDWIGNKQANAENVSGSQQPPNCDRPIAFNIGADGVHSALWLFGLQHQMLSGSIGGCRIHSVYSKAYCLGQMKLPGQWIDFGQPLITLSLPDEVRSCGRDLALLPVRHQRQTPMTMNHGLFCRLAMALAQRFWILTQVGGTMVC